MRQRICYFLVVFVLGFCGNIFSQQDSLYIKLPIDYDVLNNFNFEKQLMMVFPLSADSTRAKSLASTKRNFSCWENFGRKFQMPEKRKDSVVCQPGIRLYLLNPVPKDFYSSNLSFFCQKELQIEKLTSVPLRFRLGSLDYVNWLEQKPNAQRH